MSGFWDIDEGHSLDDLEKLFGSASALAEMKKYWKEMD